MRSSAEVRKWLKDDEAWKKYRNVKMEWITHHNPDLVILDAAGNEKERCAAPISTPSFHPD